MKNRVLSVILFSIAIIMTSCMGVQEVDPANYITPEFKSAEVVDDYSLIFELKASVTSDKGKIAECGFYYGQSEDMSDAERVTASLSEGEFSTSLTLKDYGTKFYVRSFISNGGEGAEILSSKLELNIKELSSYVKFGDPGSMNYSSTDKSVELSFPYGTARGVDVTSVGICYGKSKDIDITGSHLADSDNSDNLIDALVEGLTSGETYYFRPYLCDGDLIAYGETIQWEASSVPVVEMSAVSDITAGSAKIIASVTDDCGREVSERGVVYAEGDTAPFIDSNKIVVSGDLGEYSVVLEGLDPNKTYSVRAFAVNSVGVAYSEVQKFTTLVSKPIVGTKAATSVWLTSAVLNAEIINDGGDAIPECGFYWGETETLDKETANRILCPGMASGTGTGATFAVELKGLEPGKKYYYKAFAVNSAGESVGLTGTFRMDDLIDLNAGGETANCYIVSGPATYKFKSVKGNSSESVGTVASTEVLWESFGTSVTPEIGDLVEIVDHADGYVYFKVPDSFKEGNALIAVKDASETILWSWHIWLTDRPEEQLYYNYAGVMMDRNLGATSATPGDPCAHGLLYQWGRKDPFLGSSDTNSSTVAASTLSWPSPTTSNVNGTIEYAVEHPTTFIQSDVGNKDWFYDYFAVTGSTDNTRWQSEKTIYDPCPPGWCVPERIVWRKALNLLYSSDLSFTDLNYDMNLTGILGDSESIWYPPTTGLLYNWSTTTTLTGFGTGYYWTVTPYDKLAVSISYSKKNGLNLDARDYRAQGLAVRCYKIGSGL